MDESKMTEARQIAAQCWCDKETEHLVMDTRLAEAFAKRLALLMPNHAHHITVARAIERIGRAIHEGRGPGSYYHSWLCNIAMPILDMRGKLDLTTHEGAERMAAILLDHFWPKPGPSISMLPPIDAEIALDVQLRQDVEELLRVLRVSNGSRHRSIAITHLEDVVARLNMDVVARHDARPPEPSRERGFPL